MSTKRDRILGAFLGCAIGDAMGAPTETRPIELIKRDVGDGDYVREFKIPRPDTLPAGMPAGMVTDDFSVSYLTALFSLNGEGKITTQACKDALIDWVNYDRYFLAHSGRTSKEAIARLTGGTVLGKPDHSHDYCYMSNDTATNGAGMKAWVAGVFNPGNIKGAIDDAITMVKVSHDNPVALSAGCAVAAATAVAVARGSIADVVDAAIFGAEYGYKHSWHTCSKFSTGASVAKRIRMAVAIGINYAHDFDTLLQKMTDIVGTGINANEAIPAAIGFFVAAQGRVMDGVYMAVNAGNDTDTVAAIVGALCGAYSGTEGIPEDYLPFLTEVNELAIEEVADRVNTLTD